jgi:hypothetical protein
MTTRNSTNIPSRIVCSALLFGVLRCAIARDACETTVPDSRFDLVLKSTKFTSAQGLTGTFVLTNSNLGHILVLPGTRSRNTFLMDYPDVLMQFLNSGSVWESVPELAGSFISPPDRLRIQPGLRARITTPLSTPDGTRSSGSKFRIMIRLFDPDICVISRPFDIQ